MKTNVVLNSKDRSLFGVVIKQQTKNEMLSISDLQKAYETARWQYGWSDKQLSGIMRGKDFSERVYHLLFERGLIKVQINAFMEMVDRESIVKVLKGLGVWTTSGRGATKAVYADPYIWILLALELNPLIYAKVIIWLTDTLIFDRIEAGTKYLPMNQSIAKVITNPNYPVYARLINERVFGQHISGMRNLASARELAKVSDIEKLVISTINLGFVKTEEDLINTIKKG